MEDEIARKQRLQAIERANKHAHDNQDQVKAFHSKMLLAEVLQEREMQEELKKRKKVVEKEIEHQWIEVEKVKLHDFDTKERKKLEELYKKKTDNSKMIKNQLYEAKLGYIKKLKEERIEGEIIKQQVLEEQERERER